ncbi:MAG TPA: response regulator [Thermohalobaculum sp.]|nr:response regulator [Thermohalobaculum sp.]
MTRRDGKIYVVDDDEAVRDSIEALLSSIGYATEAFGSAQQFLESFDPSGAACILLDVSMPEMDGVTLLESMGADRRGVPVIMVTGHGDVPLAVRAMQAGAVDFVEKPFEENRLLQSIELAITSARSAPVATDDNLAAQFARLTPRETDVMRQMVIGHPNKVIAYNLGLSPRTVEIHRGRVMQKTGADSLSHLVRLAIKAGHDPDSD